MLNRVTLMGRLVADPELRQTTNGTSTCKFTIACEKDYTPKGQERQADFITIEAWRQLAEFICKYFAKGSMIVIDGAISTGSYTDKKYPEIKHYITAIVADKAYFAEKKQSIDSAQEQSKDERAAAIPEGFTDAIGELPF